MKSQLYVWLAGCRATSHKNSFCSCGDHTDSHGPENTVASDDSVSLWVSGMEYSIDYPDKMPIRVHPSRMLSRVWQQFRYAILLYCVLLLLILLVGLPVAMFYDEPRPSFLWSVGVVINAYMVGGIFSITEVFAYFFPIWKVCINFRLFVICLGFCTLAFP